jgi:hypothetical protein
MLSEQNPDESITVWLAFHNPMRRRFTFSYSV